MNAQQRCKVNSHETPNLTAKGSQVEIFYTDQKIRKQAHPASQCLALA
jgi:hypothetical protein